MDGQPPRASGDGVRIGPMEPAAARAPSRRRPAAAQPRPPNRPRPAPDGPPTEAPQAHRPERGQPVSAPPDPTRRSRLPESPALTRRAMTWRVTVRHSSPRARNWHDPRGRGGDSTPAQLRQRGRMARQSGLGPPPPRFADPTIPLPENKGAGFALSAFDSRYARRTGPALSPLACH